MELSPEEQLKTLLRARGLRFTPDRLRVFRALADAPQPLSVPALINIVATDGVNQATVYRTLEQFLAMAVVQTVLLHDGVVGYELVPPFSSHHHHFICLDCGTIQALPADSVDTALFKSLEGSGLKAMGHKIDIYGQCERCHSDTD
ncbi:MAG: Fur family transcriptional regulator [Sulfobacillus sp.]